MTKDENGPEVSVSSETSGPQTPPTTPLFIQETEPEFNLPDSQRLAMEVAPGASFTVRSWHAPYAAALMASPSEKSDLIATAERAIFHRYLELLVAPTSTEEGLDLQYAIEALSQVKKESAILRRE